MTDMLTLCQILARRRRPLRPPGQGPAARLHAGRRAGRRGHPGLEQVAPRAHHRRLASPAASARPPTPRCANWAGRSPTTWTPTTSAWKRWTASSPPPISTPSTWPTRSASPPPRTRSRPSPTAIPISSAACRSPASSEPFADDAGRRGADRRQVPARRAGGRADLPAHRRGQGRGHVHHRSVDGRDRQPADAARTAGHPGRHRRREDPDPDDRAEVHRPLQQGRRLRRRPGAVREGVPARTSR